jgi:hypothetical protein
MQAPTRAGAGPDEATTGTSRTPNRDQTSYTPSHKTGVPGGAASRADSGDFTMSKASDGHVEDEPAGVGFTVVSLRFHGSVRGRVPALASW